MFLDPAHSRWVVQVFCGSQEHIWVVLKNAQCGVAPLTQNSTNIVGVMAVVNCKLVLFKLKGPVTNGTIIPLKFQQKVIIRGGQPKPIQSVYIRLARTAQEVAFIAVNYEVFTQKFPTTDGAEQHINTPGDYAPGA
jgi:hypothetical protein